MELINNNDLWLVSLTKLSTHHFIRRVTFILSEISDALLDSCEYSNYLQLQVPYFLD